MIVLKLIRRLEQESLKVVEETGEIKAIDIRPS